MVAFEDQQLLLFALKLLVKLLCVSMAYHFVIFGSQKQNTSLLAVYIDLLNYIQLAQTHSRFLLHIFVDSPVEAGEEAVKKTQTAARYLFL